MKESRIGIIGCGNIARAHVRALVDGEGVVCAGLCDIIPEHAQRLNAECGGKFRIFESALDMVRSEDIDGVVIATPNYQHAPLFRLAAEYKKAILCQKPLTLTVAEAEDMVRVAKENHVKTLVGLCSRFEPQIEAAMEHIRDGQLGEIYFARTDYLRRRGTPTGWFGHRAKSGGGPLIDVGIHNIDVCWYMMGKPRPLRVKALNYAKIKNKYPKGVKIYTSYEKDDIYDVEDSSHGLITLENGAGILYQASWAANVDTEPERIELMGTKGGFVFKPCKLIREEVSGMTDTELHYPPHDCYTREMEAFGRIIRDEEESRTPVEDGLEVQKMLNGLYESAKSGREVEL